MLLVITGPGVAAEPSTVHGTNFLLPSPNNRELPDPKCQQSEQSRRGLARRYSFYTGVLLKVKENTIDTHCKATGISQANQSTEEMKEGGRSPGAQLTKVPNKAISYLAWQSKRVVSHCQLSEEIFSYSLFKERA